MRVIDPGHIYKLEIYDKEINSDTGQILAFVKRNNPPEKYPGNTNAHPGTTTQEVLRALIERIHYVNKQERCEENSQILADLRSCIYLLEKRHWKKKGKNVDIMYKDEGYFLMMDIENIPTCKLCGHIFCREECE